MASELIWMQQSVIMAFLCSFLHFAALMDHDDDSLDDYIRHSYTYDMREYDDLGFPLDEHRERPDDGDAGDVAPLEFVYDARFPSRFLPIDRRGRFDLLNPSVGPEGAPFVEGDMVFPEAPPSPDEEGEAAAEEEDDDGGRKLVSREELLWPPHPTTGFPFVPFVVHTSARRIRPLLHQAIRSWEKRTCITFREMPSELMADRHDLRGPQGRHLESYLEFVRDSGCWSYVGRQYRRRGSQKLSIGRGCTRLGTVLHEIGHALGLLHEQSRKDRDEHVKILLDNVMHGKHMNFYKWKDSRFDQVPYDYSSVMHYGSYFFSRAGRPTLLPTNPFHQHLLGQREGFSYRDVAAANSIYGCVKRWEVSCGASTLKCENGGYLFKTCRCLCPPGTAGPTCASVTGDYYPQLKCGGNVTSPQSITSPRYPRPFPANTWCMWWARAPRPCQRVRLVVGGFELLRSVGGVCHWDLFEVRLRDPLEAGGVYCGRELSPGQELVSEGRDMFIVFRGKYGYVSGFSARLDFVEGEWFEGSGGEGCKEVSGGGGAGGVGMKGGAVYGTRRGGNRGGNGAGERGGGEKGGSGGKGRGRTLLGAGEDVDVGNLLF